VNLLELPVSRSVVVKDQSDEDLREALTGLIEEFGTPRDLSITVAA
jgi:hypothetical protein